MLVKGFFLFWLGQGRESRSLIFLALFFFKGRA